MTLPVPDRKQLRAQLIARREALPADERRVLTERIEAHVLTLLGSLRPDTLGFCWPYRGEVDLRGAITAWLAAAPYRRAGLPVVPEGAGALTFRQWQPGAALALDRFGIALPSQGALLQPAVLLIPVNAFDARGYRIGYGGGFFDRTLAAGGPAPITVGVGFELARIDDVQPQAHDRPLDWIVTETGYARARTETP